VRAADRTGAHPLVIAGGIAMQINPEPVAPFLDAVLVGEAEVLVGPFLEVLERAGGLPRADLLRALARLPGGYVPGLYDVEYADTRAPAGQWVTRFEPREGAPPSAARPGRSWWRAAWRCRSTRSRWPPSSTRCWWGKGRC
jgi:radical SAM superfamily enzyme YgiQ (UPF0313 family)